MSFGSLAKLSDRKTPLTAADLLNDRVVPFFDAHEVKLSRMLTDRGTEYCGTPERHEDELYLAVEDVDHSRTKTKSPQTADVIDKSFLYGSAVPGFKWSSQHLERGGCDDCSEAAFGSVRARRVALAWSALCCAA